MASPVDHIDQHLQSLSFLEKRYQTNLSSGLSSTEAGIRLARRGRNEDHSELIWATPKHVLEYILSGMNVLVFLSILLLVLGYALSSASSTANLYLINPLALVVGAQTYANYSRSADSRGSPAPQAKVIVVRDGVKKRVPTAKLVSGDICELVSGDRVPADLRVISDRLQVDQTSLKRIVDTPLLVWKTEEVVANIASPLVALNLLFASTHIVAGSGRGLVLNCGKKTVISRQSTTPNTKEKFPLSSDLRFFYLSLSAIAVLLGALFLIIGVWVASGGAILVNQLASNAMTGIAGIILSVVPLHFQLILLFGLRICRDRLANRKIKLAQLAVVPTMSAISAVCIDEANVESRAIERLRAMGIATMIFFTSVASVKVHKDTVVEWLLGEQVAGVDDNVSKQPQGFIEIKSLYVKPSERRQVVVSSRALDTMSEPQLVEYLFGKAEVSFVELRMVQKRRVVEALKLGGATVAYYGTEEGEILKVASVGFGSDVMGMSSLLHVVDGVVETRRGVNNLRKVFMFFLTSFVPRLMPFIILFCAGYPLAISVVLLVVSSLLIDIGPAWALLEDPAELDVCKRRPREEKRERLISEKMIIVSCLCLGLLGSFSGFLGFTQSMSDLGFDPNGLGGLGWAELVVFENLPESSEPGFPPTTGISLSNLSQSRLDNVHLCGRAGDVSGYRSDTFSAIAENDRCGGPLFTLDLFNEYCYNTFAPTSSYSISLQDKVSLFTAQKGDK